MPHYIKVISLLLITALASCAGTGPKQHYNDDLLYSVHSSFVGEDGSEMDGYYKNREQFIKPYTSVKYINDTIIATTFYEVNACAEPTGHIKLSGDTLQLLAVGEGEISCTSIQFRQFTYKIRNTDKKRYVIKY